MTNREISNKVINASLGKKRFARVALATMLAASLAAAPAVQATALQREAGAASQEQITNVVDIARAQGIAGVDTLELYLQGAEVSEGAVLGIDAASLAGIDAAVAAEIASLQAALTTPVEPQDPVVPETPETPEVSDTPEVPETPDTPEGPETPETPEEPETPTEPENPDTPDVPETPETPDTSNTADTSDASAVPETPDTPAASAPETEAPSQGLPAESSDYPQWSYSGDNTYVPKFMVNMDTEKFIALVGEQAREIGQENDLYASVMIAQAILESASGTSTLASEHFNLFGIKGSYQGESVRMVTREDDGTGSLYSITSGFRSYPSVRESLQDYAELLTDSMGYYYRGAWKTNAETLEEACEWLQGRYATDTMYAAKLKALIDTYDLQEYDEALDYEEVETYEVQAKDAETGDLLFDDDGEPVMEERGLTDLMAELTSHLGEKYVWGGTVPGAFDCSGLVQYSYREALGVELPRTTYYQCLAGEDVDFDDLHMGDLVFFVNEGENVGHVGVYLGNGCYIEAPQPGDVVKITYMEDAMPDFAKRVVPVQPTDEQERDIAEARSQKNRQARAAAWEAAYSQTAKKVPEQGK